MRVLLINPPYAIERYMGRHLARVGWVLPPMGLLYVAAALEQEGIKVTVSDAQLEHRPLHQVLAAVRPAVVGITCSSALAGSARRTVQLVRLWSATVPIVLGGVHPTVLPEQVAQWPGVDMVVRGEGTRTMVEICNAIANHQPWRQISGIAYLEPGSQQVRQTAARSLQPADELPIPARHLVPMFRYKMSPDWSMRRPFDLVFTAFGCPHRCIFCAAQSVNDGRFRQRSIEAVMEEVDQVISTYQLRSLLFGDDSFVYQKHRVLELCERYSARGYHRRVPWQVSSRVDTVDAEVLQAMQKAGCFLISFGIETAVPRLLERLDKGTTVEQSVRAVRLAKEAGLRVRGTFMLGIPGETHHDSLATIRLSRALPLDQVRFAVATPFPGTELWRIAQEEQGIQIDDWMRLSLMGGYRSGKLAYVPRGRCSSELKRLQRRANLGFFLRPQVLLGYLSRVRSARDLGSYLNGAWELLRASLGS